MAWFRRIRTLSKINDLALMIGAYGARPSKATGVLPPFGNESVLT